MFLNWNGVFPDSDFDHTPIVEEQPKQVPEQPEKFTDMYKKTFGRFLSKQEDEVKEPEIKAVKVEAESLEELENVSIFANSKASYSAPSYKYVGTWFSTYVAIEMENSIYIVDQHAAHERLVYEKIKNNFYEDGDKDSQIMLLPDIIELSNKEKNVVKENIELFRKAGFTLDEFGEKTLRLIGVPSVVLELDTKELFKEILDEINTVAITALQEKEEKLISTIACKAAVKANMKLSEEEVKSLMDKLLELENPFTCPHGRPTAIRMNKSDIEKKFGRK